MEPDLETPQDREVNPSGNDITPPIPTPPPRPEPHSNTPKPQPFPEHPKNPRLHPEPHPNPKTSPNPRKPSPLPEHPQNPHPHPKSQSPQNPHPPKPLSSKEGLDYWDQYLKRDHGKEHKTSISQSHQPEGNKLPPPAHGHPSSIRH